MRNWKQLGEALDHIKPLIKTICDATGIRIVEAPPPPTLIKHLKVVLKGVGMILSKNSLLCSNKDNISNFHLAQLSWLVEVLVRTDG